MSVNLRDATNADRPRCLALLGELSGATGSAHAQVAGDVFEQLVSQARGRIVVAEEADTLLGMATVSYNLAMRYDGEYCQLEELIVSPAARGKNVGGLLIQRTIQDARERGCAEMGLYLIATTKHNEPFYEKYSFTTIGEEMRQTLT